MDLPVSIRLTLLIRPDDFNFVPDPIWRQVYSTAVATGFDPLFDHLFTVDLKLYLIAGRFWRTGRVYGRLFVIIWS